MTPAIVRLTMGLRETIEANGRIEGAALTVERSTSVVGDWNNINKPALPNWEQLVKLEQVAVAQGALPGFTCALARELGGVFVPAGFAAQSDAPLAMGLVRLLSEFGDTARATEEALRDGAVTAAEARGVRREAEGAMQALAAFIAQLDAVIWGREA